MFYHIFCINLKEAVKNLFFMRAFIFKYCKRLLIKRLLVKIKHNTLKFCIIYQLRIKQIYGEDFIF